MATIVPLVGPPRENLGGAIGAALGKGIEQAQKKKALAAIQDALQSSKTKQEFLRKTIGLAKDAEDLQEITTIGSTYYGKSDFQQDMMHAYAVQKGKNMAGAEKESTPKPKLYVNPKSEQDYKYLPEGTVDKTYVPAELVKKEPAAKENKPTEADLNVEAVMTQSGMENTPLNRSYARAYLRESKNMSDAIDKAYEKDPDNQGINVRDHTVRAKQHAREMMLRGKSVYDAVEAGIQQANKDLGGSPAAVESAKEEAATKADQLKKQQEKQGQSGLGGLWSSWFGRQPPEASPPAMPDQLKMNIPPR